MYPRPGLALSGSAGFTDPPSGHLHWSLMVTEMDIFDSWQNYSNHNRVRALIVEKTSMKVLKPLPSSQAKIINQNHHISGPLEDLKDAGMVVPS